MGNEILNPKTGKDLMNSSDALSLTRGRADGNSPLLQALILRGRKFPEGAQKS
jgi:hypothetical protein